MQENAPAQAVIAADVWIFDFSEQKLVIFQPKKWILFVFKAFEELKYRLELV